jgi:hypothetical protein
MTTENIIDQEEYHLIQPYDGSYEPNHYEDDEPTIIEDEDDEELIVEQEEEDYL